jgi:hypothetical protein
MITPEDVLDEFSLWLDGQRDCPAKRWAEENLPSMLDAEYSLLPHVLAA